MVRTRLTASLVVGKAVGALVALTVCALARAAPQPFDVPPQSLARALHSFSVQADIDVAFSGELLGTTASAGARGQLEPVDALRLLLQDTGFGLVLAGRGFAIVRAPDAGTRTSGPQRTALSAAVVAQGDDTLEQLNEVVITGTLLRGVTPAGSLVTSILREDIERTGATQSNQLLGIAPQVANAFNVLPNVPTAAQGRTTFRPNLRALPPLGNGTTLVLVDGHNVVGAGVQQNSPDIGVLPVGAIERVELVLDSGSAIYGSDAMAGTLNVITRSHFEGVEVGADYGGAGAHHRQQSLHVTAGTNWRGGGMVLAASARAQSAMPATDLPLPRLDLRGFGLSDLRVNNACAPGNVIAGAGAAAQIYRLPDLAASASGNLCDPFLDTVVTPRERQLGLYASVSHALADNLEFQLKAFGAERETRSLQSQISSSARVGSGNPWFIPLPDGVGVPQSAETVTFNWQSVLGRHATSRVQLNQFDITPTLRWRLANDWRVTALAGFGWSRTVQDLPGINTTALATALAASTVATAFNPYAPASSPPAVLDSIVHWRNHTSNRQRMSTARLLAEGVLLQLPAGELRGAFGIQYQRLSKEGWTVSGSPAELPAGVSDRLTRDVSSLFGEASIPLHAAVTLSLSGRHDHYQDVGGTTNPKFGLTWQPREDLALRASWGTAFVAPSLQDSITGGIDAQVQINNGNPLQPTQVRTGDAASFGNAPNVVLTGGGGAGLRPVTADTWSFSADFNAARSQGLSVGATYWAIDMQDVIQSGCTGNFVDQLNDPSLDGRCYYYRPSQALAQTLTNDFQVTIGGNRLTDLYAANTPPYYIVTRQRRNFGRFRTRGVDVRARYGRVFHWGTFAASINGTHYLSRRQQGVAGGPFLDQLDDNFPPTSIAASLRAQRGPLTLAVTANYLSGFDITGASPTATLPSFTPVNLHARYQFGEQLTATLNINNLGAVRVPVANFQGGGGIFQFNGLPYHGTLGRYVAVGLTRRI